MTTTQTTSSVAQGVHKAASLIALFVLIFSFFVIAFFASALLTAIGVPSFIVSALYLAFFYTTAFKLDEIKTSFYLPLCIKMETTLISASTTYNKAKTWVKGLFSKAEAAPEAAVAA